MYIYMYIYMCACVCVCMCVCVFYVLARIEIQAVRNQLGARRTGPVVLICMHIY